MMKEGWVRDRPEGARDQTTRHEKKRCEKKTMSEVGGGRRRGVWDMRMRSGRGRRDWMIRCDATLDEMISETVEARCLGGGG